MCIRDRYGIVQPGRPTANPMLLSSHVVAAYAALSTVQAGHARWDDADEDPLADARGFRLDRASAHPSLLTDNPTRPAGAGPVTDAALDALTLATAPRGDGGAHVGMDPSPLDRPEFEEYEDPGAATTILTNGARLYVDHAHPEYSSPEVTNPRDLVLWDKAGEAVMLRAVRALTANAAMPDVVLYKNNVDGKGASYGTHENYLVERAVPFEDLVTYLTPFLVTRQVFTGAGRVGIGPTGQVPGFQLSQRADYIEAEVGLETTLRRPIINTRDEPHADRKLWRRLHLILGDATLLEAATYLRVGTTSLVLWLIESGAHQPFLAEVERLRLADPVAAVRQVSRDLFLTGRLELADGRRLTALEVQRAYLDIAGRALAASGATDTRAYFRGTVVRRFPGQVRAASWDSIVLDVPAYPSLRRVPLRDPLRGTKAHVGALLDACPDAETLVERLAGR